MTRRVNLALSFGGLELTVKCTYIVPSGHSYPPKWIYENEDSHFDDFLVYIKDTDITDLLKEFNSLEYVKELVTNQLEG